MFLRFLIVISTGKYKVILEAASNKPGIVEAHPINSYFCAKYA
jgi:hypothetical protein